MKMSLLSYFIVASFLSSTISLIMPMTKSDGSLDVSSLLSHITLLEQQLATKASADDLFRLESTVVSKSEFNLVQSQLTTALSELKEAKTQLTTTQSELKVTQSQLTTAQNDLKETKTQLTTTQSDLKVTQSQLTTSQNDLKETKTRLTTTQAKLDIALEELQDLSTVKAVVAVLQNQMKSLSENNTGSTSEQHPEDLSGLRADVSTLQSDVAQLQNKTSVLQSEMKILSSNTTSAQHPGDVTGLIADVSNLQSEMVQLQNKTTLLGRKTGGTYIRWGRTICPNESTIVYKGYTGGTYFRDMGGASSILCLPEDPIYDFHTSSNYNVTSHIYGAEYRQGVGPYGRGVWNDDVPCVVCQSSSRASTVMVPARNSCHHGWNLEYTGYLMSSYPDQSSSEYICVDKDPEAIPGGHALSEGLWLYLVESKCGSLKCPPYVQDWELTCSVCSK